MKNRYIRFVITIILSLGILTACNDSVQDTPSSIQFNSTSSNDSSKLERWVGSSNGMDYDIYQISDSEYVISYTRNRDHLGYILHNKNRGAESIDFSQGNLRSKIYVTLQDMADGSISALLTWNGGSEQFFANRVSPKSQVDTNSLNGEWISTILGENFEIDINNESSRLSGAIGSCNFSSQSKSYDNPIKSGSLVDIIFFDQNCAQRFGERIPVRLLRTQDVLIMLGDGEKNGGFFVFGHPKSSSSKTLAPRRSDCYQWVAQCRARCSMTALPSGDFGFRFWNCVNSCARINGC